MYRSERYLHLFCKITMTSHEPTRQRTVPIMTENVPVIARNELSGWYDWTCKYTHEEYTPPGIHPPPRNTPPGTHPREYTPRGTHPREYNPGNTPPGEYTSGNATPGIHPPGKYTTPGNTPPPGIHPPGNTPPPGIHHPREYTPGNTSPGIHPREYTPGEYTPWNRTQVCRSAVGWLVV